MVDKDGKEHWMESIYMPVIDDAFYQAKHNGRNQVVLYNNNILEFF